MAKKRGFSKIYIALIMVLLYLPVLIVIVYSFNQSRTGAVWMGFTLDWYGEMVGDRRLLESLVTSLRVAGGTCLVSCVLGTLGAVAAARFSIRAKKMTNLLMYVPLIVPEIILGVALLMFFSVTPLKYGVLTMILSHTTFGVPYVFIMVTIRLRAMDASLVEAARDLGASSRKAFSTVTLPLIMPGILSGALISMAMSLDDVVISSFVSGPESTTLPIRIFSMLKLGVTPKINALSTIMIFVMFTAAGLLQFFSAGKRRQNA